MSQCLTENQVVALVEGRLPKGELDLLHRHIDSCPLCHSLIADVALPSAVEATDGAFSQAAVTLLLEAPRQIEEYRLLRPLGQGAMGQVYLAHDTRLDRSVALKFISAKEPDAEARDRFFVEARAIARLSHPNVVGIYRIGEAEGRPYLVSELIRGQSLDHLPLPQPTERVLALALGLSRGLGAAHRRGVLHRDIKPANAILAEDGEVKLLDFGLAKLLEAAPGAGSAAQAVSRPGLPDLALVQTAVVSTEASPKPGSLTRTGALLGTPMYMAPELWRGAAATRQADVYALGALLYELSAGHPPYQATSLQELYRQLKEQDAPPLSEAAPGIDPRLADVVDRCLRKNPVERFSSGEELHHALSRLTERPSGPAAGGNPYRGLLPFELEHRGLFFGRTAEVQAVLERLRGDSMVLVAGDSGVGKSSLCRAGVLGRVKEGALGEERPWSLIYLVPGMHPAVSLCDALAPALGDNADALLALLRGRPDALVRRLRESRLVLFIDQMEELVTLSEPGEAAAVGELLGLLAARHPGLRVLLTARGDYLTRLAALPGLGDDLSRLLYILRPLSPEGLREAIVGPAEARGVRFETEELIEELMRAGAQGEGGLPLLQFALTELWEARDLKRQLISDAALASIGGVTGALSRHADGVLAGLLPGQRAAVQRILGKLVTMEGTRARRPAAALIGAEEGERVALEALVRGRLLVAREAEGETAYEVAHEALVAGWGTLREWLAGDKERRTAQERVEVAAGEWERLERSPEALWSSKQLVELQLVELELADLLPRAQYFVAASRQHAARRRRARWGVIAALVGLPLALALAGVQWRRTQEQHRRAAAAALAELGARATSLAQVPGREVDSLVAGVKAVTPDLRAHRPPSAQALEGLSAAVLAGGRSITLRGHEGIVWSALISPDGRQILTAGEDKTARLWDGSTGEPLRSLVGHAGPVGQAMFSPDGSTIVTVSADHTGRLWDARSGQLRAVLVGHSDRIIALSLSPDGDRVITASADQTARLWDARSGAALGVLVGHTARVNAASFSPDGTRIATASEDGTARLWDGKTLRHLATLIGPSAEVDDPTPAPVPVAQTHGMAAAVFSPDSQRLATAHVRSHQVGLWDARTGVLRTWLKGHLDNVFLLRFSPDGAHLFGAGTHPWAWLWDGRTGALRATLKGHSANPVAVAFSPDGGRLATTGADNTIRLWDIPSGASVAMFRGHSSPPQAVAFSADGRRIVTAGGFDGNARLLHLDGGDSFRSFTGHAGMVMRADFSPDGRYAVTAGWDKTARVWDLRTGESVATLLGHTSWLMWVAFSPDGEHVLTVGDTTARVWDWRRGQTLAVLPGEGSQMMMAAFSPNGEHVVTVAAKRAQVWEWRTGRRLLALPRQEDGLAHAEFLPDGRRFVTSAGQSNLIRIWDAQTGKLLGTLPNGEATAVLAPFPVGVRVLVVDHSARILDLQTGAVLFTLTGHVGVVNYARVSKDGLRAVTSGFDRSVRVWDTRTGRALSIIRGDESVCAALSPDGQQVIACYPDRATIYPATTEAFLVNACRLLRYQPELAEVKGECQPYLPQTR